MNEKEAINVLVQAAVIGQQSGIYSLKDAALVYAAVNILVPNYFAEEENQAPQTENGNDTKDKKENK
jgi:hypothetical protein